MSLDDYRPARKYAEQHDRDLAKATAKVDATTQDEVGEARKRADRDVWKTGLHSNSKGFIGDEFNVLVALRIAPVLVGLVRFNQFALEVEFTRAPPWRAVAPGTPWAEADDTALMVWLQAEGIPVRSRSTVADTVVLAAQDHAYHPVRGYLDGLQWDGEPRLAIWPQEYLNADGPGDYLAAVGPAFLRSAVARIMQPGCQSDHMLVLEGPQGIGKSTVVKTLAKEPSWYADNLPDVHSKDAALQLSGRWIIEVNELKAIRGSQLEAVKAFITTTVDTFRPPYGRRTAQFARQSVFVGTTNESDYLRDRTGNRRYWPIRCGRIRLDALQADRDQLWAEAVHTYRAGEPWHLSGDVVTLAAAEQRGRVFVSELEADVAEYLANRTDTSKEISVQDVLVHCLGLDRMADSYAEQARRLGPAIAEALEACGWRKAGRTRDEARTRRTLYRFPDAGQGGQGK